MESEEFWAIILTHQAMSLFFAQYIDHFVHFMCVVCTLLNTTRLVRRATVPLRRVPAFFVVFGATTVATFMGFGHLFEISFHSLERAATGTFVYDFRFYSLILMGVVLLSLSVGMLRAIENWFKAVPGSRQAIYRFALQIIALSAPMFFFTPIAAAPVMACLITLMAMPFAIKKENTAKLNPTQAAPVPSLVG